MAHISPEDASAWIDPEKIDDTALDASLEDAASVLVLGALSNMYDSTDWSTPSTTPSLVRKIIAMHYVAYVYNREYSEDDGLSEYAAFLLSQAQVLLEALISGSITLPEEEAGPGNVRVDTPIFEPRESEPVFTMGVIW